MNIAEILQRQVKERPDAPAIIDMHAGRERVTTFAGLDAASAKGTALLREAGLVEGDTVLVFQPMSAELYIVLMALFRAGMTAMFLDPSAGREHIARCCAIRPPQALVASSKAQLLRLISPALRHIHRHICLSRFMPGCIPWHRADTLQPCQMVTPCTADAPALITFTSGSTGQPKAAVRSHGFLLEQHRVLERAISLTPGAVDLTTLPVFVLANLASGVTSLIPDADLRCPGKIKALPVLRQIDRHRPASVVASPAFLECICGACETSERTSPAAVFTTTCRGFCRTTSRRCSAPTCCRFRRCSRCWSRRGTSIRSRPTASSTWASAWSGSYRRRRWTRRWPLRAARDSPSA